jgi:UDP-N-acetylmuramate-alanine ligase
MIICLNNLYIQKHTYTHTKKKRRREKEIIHHCDRVLFMSIYIYGFQSFGDDGLRELDETVEDDDDNEEHALVEFAIDE